MEHSDWIEKELARLPDLPTGADDGPRARAARYDRKNARVVVELDNDCTFTFPPALAQGLENASATQLAAVEIAGRGYGLHWPALDADLSVPGMLAGLFGSKAWMRKAGGKGGAVSSPAKTAAARANGLKGGRPKKAA